MCNIFETIVSTLLSYKLCFRFRDKEVLAGGIDYDEEHINNPFIFMAKREHYVD